MSSFSLFSLRSMVSSLFTLFSRECRAFLQIVNQSDSFNGVTAAGANACAEDRSPREADAAAGKREVAGTQSHGEEDTVLESE